MKKYVGLTMYFIGLILISYTFFIISGNHGVKNNEKEIKNEEVVENNKTQDTTENISNQNNSNTESENNHNESNKDDNSINRIVNVGYEKLYLVIDNSNETLYDILGVKDLPTYKTQTKEIYLKVLNSIDYYEKKDNIERLIEKIGENVAETNLFGEKQMFVNLKGYYKKTSIMLVKYREETYLVVFPYDEYENYKEFFNEFLFVN